MKDLPEGQQKVEKQQRLQQLLDSGYGECHLRRPEVAASVEAILLERDAIDYRLFEWVSMPNHVHALVEVAAHAPLWKVVKGWKGASATTANRLVGSSGTFWWREYHDRFMRDEGHFHTSVAYVRNNPVKAGLCKLPEDWRFGSAYWREASE